MKDDTSVLIPTIGILLTFVGTLAKGAGYLEVSWIWVLLPMLLCFGVPLYVGLVVDLDDLD